MVNWFDTVFQNAGTGFFTLWAKKGQSNQTRWFSVSNSEQSSRAQKIASQLDTDGWDVYFSTCLSGTKGGSGQGYARIKADDVTCIPSFFVDLDIRDDRHPHCPETAEDGLTSLMRLPIPPSLVVHSGGGLHAYWLLDKPIAVRSAEDLLQAKDSMKRFACAVRAATGYESMDSHASEPARVLRVPGTHNYKQQPRPVVLLKETGHFYGLEQLAPFVSQHDQALSEKQITKSIVTTGMASIDWQEKLQRAFQNPVNGAKIQQLYNLPPEQSNDPSADDMALMNHLAYLLDKNPFAMEEAFKASARGKRLKAERADYIARTIGHAIHTVGNTAQQVAEERQRKCVCSATAPVTGDLPSHAKVQITPSSIADVMSFIEVEYEEPRFLVSPYIPLGKVTIIQGDPGTGKTALACKIAAVVSIGGTLIKQPCCQGNVLMLSNEDDASTLRGRIEASGGDPSRCFFIPDASKIQFLSSEIEEAVKGHAIKLLIFDPLQSFLGSGVDMFRANETRPVMNQLGQMAKRNDCAVVIISHMNKGVNGTKAIYRALGSVDIVGAARSVLYVGRNPEDDGQCIVCQIKSSNAQTGKSFAYRIGQKGGVEWEGYSILTAEDLQQMARRKSQGVCFDDDPVVVTVSYLLEENPHGVFVSYEQLGNYASKIFGYSPCTSGQAWHDKLNALQRELLERRKIRFEFVNTHTTDHIELGQQIAPTGKGRGIRIQKYTPLKTPQIGIGAAS